MGLHRHPDIASLSDAAFRAWIVVLAEAKIQPEQGAFRSEDHLRRLLGWRLARCLPSLVSAGLLAVDKSGRVVVESWSRWQSPGATDRTRAERQKRYRERQKAKVTALRDASRTDDRVTSRNGGPPLQGYVAPLRRPIEGAAAVTALDDENPRRLLARAIREAPTVSLRTRYLARFDALYGHLYPRSP